MEGRVIDVRKEAKRQENIPRVALELDKLIVCSVRQAVSQFAAVLISLTPLTSQTWLCVVLCLLGRVWKAEDAHDSAVSLESQAQAHWG